MAAHFGLTTVAVAGTLLAAAFSPCQADDAAILACRQLPPGPARSDCFERASADLERQLREAGRPDFQTDGEADPRPNVSSRLTQLTYEDGRPVFRLANGQLWAATDRRRLTPHRGINLVRIERTPVGMLLHFNGSLFALQVVRRQ